MVLELLINLKTILELVLILFLLVKVTIMVGLLMKIKDLYFLTLLLLKIVTKCGVHNVIPLLVGVLVLLKRIFIIPIIMNGSVKMVGLLELPVISSAVVN